jgi:aspartate/methionine/tyrosine aminotransferase
MYPKADGQPELKQAIVDYYNSTYGSKITKDNVAIFAGGRPALFAALAFLDEDRTVLVEETEYTPYWDLLRLLKRPFELIPSGRENRFSPGIAEHPALASPFLLKSNPCNPTGVTVRGDDLRVLVDHYSDPARGGIIDEAYEFFTEDEPESALKYIDDINVTNLFVVGAATKGLQVPGMRVGWMIASTEHIEIFRNYSSFGMGGVSRASQLYVTGLFEPQRIAHARRAIGAFYTSQRQRYGEALASLGIELFSGTGGFYHWGALPAGLTAEAFNERLFRHEAGILPGPLCDMARRGGDGPLGSMMRFSFGPLGPDCLESDVEILKRCLS